MMKLDLMFIKLFVVKFRGSWKLDMAYSNNLAQLSLHLKAKKKKTQEFLHQEIKQNLTLTTLSASMINWYIHVPR